MVFIHRPGGGPVLTPGRAAKWRNNQGSSQTTRVLGVSAARASTNRAQASMTPKSELYVPQVGI